MQLKRHRRAAAGLVFSRYEHNNSMEIQNSSALAVKDK
jgi:hypothetical protein